LVEKFGIGEEAFIFVVKEIAGDCAARRLIGLEADEGCAAVGGGHVLAVEGGKDFGAGNVRPKFLPNVFLLRMVIGEGEGGQFIEVQLLIAVGLHQHRADDGELEALLHHGGGDSEPCGDILRVHALLRMERMERLELVGGMHRRPDRVFSERDFEGIVAGLDGAADRLRLGDFLALGAEQLRLPPSFADGDKKAAGEYALRIVLRFNHRALQHAVGGNRSGQRRDVGFRVRGLAGVARGFFELVQGNEQHGSAGGGGAGFLLGHDDLRLVM
jgi:hypothetical protein